jgi:hypothetical protein
VRSADLDFERSLALHRAVAAKIADHPEIIDRAHRKLMEWLAHGGRSATLWEQWREILTRSPDEIIAFITDRSERAAWLRKASPFAGVLTPAERLQVLKSTRAELESAA